MTVPTVDADITDVMLMAEGYRLLTHNTSFRHVGRSIHSETHPAQSPEDKYRPKDTQPGNCIGAGPKYLCHALSVEMRFSFRRYHPLGCRADTPRLMGGQYNQCIRFCKGPAWRPGKSYRGSIIGYRGALYIRYLKFRPRWMASFQALERPSTCCVGVPEAPVADRAGDRPHALPGRSARTRPAHSPTPQQPTPSRWLA